MLWLATLCALAPQTQRPAVAAVEPRWRVQLDAEVAAPPVVCGGHLVVALVAPPALELRRRGDGKRLARLAATSPPQPCASGDALAWHEGESLLLGRVHGERIEVLGRRASAQPWAAPLLVDGVVYAVSAGRLVCSAGAAVGTAEAPRWSRDDGFLGTPAWCGERLFAVRLARGELTLEMLDPGDGRTLDRQPTGLRIAGAAAHTPRVIASDEHVAVYLPGRDDDEPNLALLSHELDRLRAVSTAVVLAEPVWLADAVLAPVAGDAAPRWHAARVRAQPSAQPSGQLGALRDLGPAASPLVPASVDGDVLALGGVVARASSGRVLWRGPVATQRAVFDGDLLLVTAGRELHALHLRSAPQPPPFDVARPHQLSADARWRPSLGESAGDLGARVAALSRRDLGVVLTPSLAVFAPLPHAGRAAACAEHGAGVIRALTAAFAGRLPAPARLHVELFDDRAAFAASAAAPAPGGDDARAQLEAQRRAARAVGELRGYFAPEVELTRLWLPAPEADLAPTLATLSHELTHHWLHAAAALGGPQPPRLRRAGFFCVEGFATFAESLRAPEFVFGAELPLLVDASLHAAAEELLPWDVLLRVDQLGYHARFAESERVPYRGTRLLSGATLDAAALFAGQAGALCRHLWAEADTRAALLEFVARYYAGLPTAPLTDTLAVDAARLGARALRR